MRFALVHAAALARALHPHANWRSEGTEQLHIERKRISWFSHSVMIISRRYSVFHFICLQPAVLFLSNVLDTLIALRNAANYLFLFSLY